MNYDITITKRTLLDEQNNNMTAYKKYLVYFKATGGDIPQGYKRKGKFIITIFKDDPFEYYEKDTLTQAEIKEYENMVMYEFIGYDRKWQSIIQDCNESINEWNRRVLKQTA